MKSEERFSSKRFHGSLCEQSRIVIGFQGFGGLRGEKSSVRVRFVGKGFELFDRRGSSMGFFSA